MLISKIHRERRGAHNYPSVDLGEIHEEPIELSELSLDLSLTEPQEDFDSRRNVKLVEEEKELGPLRLHDYRRFLSFAKCGLGLAVIALIALAAATLQIMISVTLADWVSQDEEEQKNGKYFWTFTAVTLSFVVMSFLRNTSVNLLLNSIGRWIHEGMAERLVRAKVSFFDRNPLGRVVTRFSKDMFVLDVPLPIYANLLLYGSLRCASIFILISIVLPLSMIPLLLLIFGMVWLGKRVISA